MRKIIIVIFLSILFYFSYIVGQQVYGQYKERGYYEQQYTTAIPLKEETSLKFIDYSGLPITIEKYDPKRDINPLIINNKKELEKEESFIIPNNFGNGKLIIPSYVEADIIVPDNTTTLYNDLKKGLVWNPYTKKIYEKGIMFLQGHSGSNRGSFRYNYLDKLSLYYDEIEELEAYINMDGYIYKYRLEKKEIREPGADPLIEKNKHTLVLMTCYPRNTTQKRALFYFVLEDVYAGDI